MARITATAMKEDSDIGLQSVRVHSGILDRLHVMLTLLSLAWAAGFLARLSLVAEITTHFHGLIFWALLFVVATYAALRAWRWLALSLILTMAVGAPVVTWYMPHNNGQGEFVVRNLRILQANVLRENTQTEKLIALILEENPDILILQELDEKWTRALEAVSEKYPYSFVKPRIDDFGMGLYSKFPLQGARVNYLTEGDVPSIEAKIYINGREIALLDCHLWPPASLTLLAARNAELSALKHFVKRQTDLTIVAGDLNTAMWSPYYIEAIRESGLVNSRQGFGTVPTWPAWFPLLKIPLDHCLLSSDIQVLDTRTGPYIGSDHLPMIIDLHIPFGESLDRM